MSFRIIFIRSSSVSVMFVSRSVSAGLPNDVGILLPATISIQEASQRMENLTSGQKYHLLKNHEIPSSSKLMPLPAGYLHKCNRINLSPQVPMDGAQSVGGWRVLQELLSDGLI